MIIKEYSVNIGNYDHTRHDIEVITEVNYDGSNQRKSRFPKILSHKFFDCDVSVYWDCNISLKKGLNIENVVNDYLQDYDIVVQKCSIGRDCVYQEIEAAKTRVNSYRELELLEMQKQHYYSIGFPEHCGTLSGYQPLIRRHSPIVKAFNETWWNEIEMFSYRDQCSFPVVLSRFPELKVNWINNMGELTSRKYRHHNKSLV